MHKYLFFFFGLALFTLVNIPTARADKVLFMSPTRVLLNDADKVEVIEVTNMSDITRAYTVSVENLIMTPEGVTAPVQTFDYAAKRLVRFVPREFVLEPGKKQSIRVMSRLPADLPDGDYHSHIQFLENVSKRAELNANGDNGARMEAPLSYSTLVPVIISHGDVHVRMALKNAVASKNADGSVNVTLDVSREGNGQGTAYVDLVYDGLPAAESRAIPRNTIYIYRELSERKKVITLRNVPAGAKSLTIKLYDNPNADAPVLQEMSIALP